MASVHNLDMTLYHEAKKSMKTTFTRAIQSLGMSILLFTPQILLAQPGSGIRVGEQTLLVPEISGSFNRNDNVNLRRRAISEGGEVLDRTDSDSFISTEISLSFRNWGDATQLNGRGWLGARRYDKNTNLDRDTYGVSTGVFWTSPTAASTARLDLSFQRAIDRTEQNQDFIGDSDLSEELENVAERVERDEIRTNLSLSNRLTPRMRGTLSYHFTDLDYNEARFNDRTSHLFTGELSYRLTDKTSPYGRIGLGLDDDEGLDGYGEKPFYLLGVRYQATDKLNVNIAAGYERYTRTPLVLSPNIDEQRFDRVAGDELTNSNLKFTADIRYTATPKTSFSLRARNEYGSVASPGSSSREEIAVSLAMNHQTTRQLSQRLSVAWRQDDYLQPIPARGEEFDELKETLWFQYRADYQTVRPWLSLFAHLSYEDGSSKIPGDSYTETQITIGARARY